MKCPFRVEVLHIPEQTEKDGVTIFAGDYPQFGECYLSQCPYYVNYKSLESEDCLRTKFGNDGALRRGDR